MSKNSGLKLAGALAVGLTMSLVGSFSASANPPDKGSKQWNRMSTHGGFIKNMHIKDHSAVIDGWCCDWGDGRMGDLGEELKEEEVPDPDGGTHYRVFVTRDIFGKDSYFSDPLNSLNHAYDDVIPPEGKWIDIPRSRVVTNEDVAKNCQPEDKTCLAPTANVLWLNPNSGKPYCYWPIQRWAMQEKPGQGYRFADVPHYSQRLQFMDPGGKVTGPFQDPSERKIRFSVPGPE